jgi:6-phosphogluconolactonase (cycloisomerase 2 family)
MGEGAVFVGTNHNNTTDPNQPANQIAMYRRAVDGQLTLIDYFDTGGQGSGPSQRFAGDGLGSGNSVRLSTDNRWLFVTNAGSDTVSVFKIEADGLNLMDVAPTGDGSQGHRFPNSVTQHGDLVYVLNAADQGSITGFRLNDQGVLTPLAGSTRTIDGNQDRFAASPPIRSTTRPRSPSRRMASTWWSRSRMVRRPASSRESPRPVPAESWSGRWTRPGFPTPTMCGPTSPTVARSASPSTRRVGC